MPGGLMQLVGKGAQDQLVTGNPSFTFFKTAYKRHTEFAMEHLQLFFKTNNLNLPQGGFLTLRAKVERYADLVHDCYLTLNLPNIYSPVVPITTPPSNFNSSSNAIGYEFQWVKNIGYNMINYVSLLMNGQEIVRHTGEWMKLYANLKFDANKKAIIDEMVGNVKEFYDPANAYDRVNQYPNAISSSTTDSEPSIYGKQLRIPLHFWFCEQIGNALPLIALQNTEVEIVVELKNVYQLFTTLDVDQTSPTFGTRIAPDPSNAFYTINHFLSPPTYSNPSPTLPDLRTWNLNPYIEANYIYLSDTERAHIAKNEHSFMVSQILLKEAMGQYGPSNDLELVMRNLATQIVWVGQRSDRALQNDYDNYTNWVDPNKPPINSFTSPFTNCYAAGLLLNTSVSQRDILLESYVLLDGKERFNTKTTSFFSNIQNYRHQSGKGDVQIPGIYTYSFALDNFKMQPSGHMNGSMFNKTILRNTLVQPPLTAPSNTIATVCVLKSTANNANPTVIPNPNVTDPITGKPLYNPEDLLTVVRKGDAQTLQYSFNIRAYVESYNFVRIRGGISNVVFSS